jgi:hypothetical protein
LVTMSELYYLAGTVAIRTHVPLARHGFCVFYRNEIIDALAQFVGVVKNHRRSRADITAKVKYGTQMRPLLIPGWWDSDCAF